MLYILYYVILHIFFWFFKFLDFFYYCIVLYCIVSHCIVLYFTLYFFRFTIHRKMRSLTFSHFTDKWQGVSAKFIVPTSDFVGCLGSVNHDALGLKRKEDTVMHFLCQSDFFNNEKVQVRGIGLFKPANQPELWQIRAQQLATEPVFSTFFQEISKIWHCKFEAKSLKSIFCCAKEKRKFFYKTHWEKNKIFHSTCSDSCNTKTIRSNSIQIWSETQEIHLWLLHGKMSQRWK